MDVTFFDRTAEVIDQYLKKGEPLYVRGRLEVSEWEDKETGKARSKLEVIGNTFQFMPKSRDAEPQSVTRAPATSNPATREKQIEKMDEIPF